MSLVEGRSEDDGQLVGRSGSGVFDSDVREGVGPSGSGTVDGTLVVGLMEGVNGNSLPKFLAVDVDASDLVIPRTKEKITEGDVRLRKLGNVLVTVHEVSIFSESSGSEEVVNGTTRTGALADLRSWTSDGFEVDGREDTIDDVPVSECLGSTFGEIGADGYGRGSWRMNGNYLPSNQGKSFVGSTLIRIASPVELDSSGRRQELRRLDGIRKSGIRDSEAVRVTEIRLVDLPPVLQTFVFLLISPQSIDLGSRSSRNWLIGIEVQPSVLTIPSVGEVSSEENTNGDEVLVVKDVEAKTTTERQVVVVGGIGGVVDLGPQEETVTTSGIGERKDGTVGFQNGKTVLGGGRGQLVDDS